MEPVDGIHLLRTVIAHRDYVRLAVQSVAHELERRALAHDISKLSSDEFDGFSRINAAARMHPYGSPEYKAGLAQEKATIELHYSRNSHHPEHAKARGEAAERERGLPDDYTYWKAHAAADMTFVDIIEMVCDWRGAYLGYGSQGTWEENIQRQRERYERRFTEGQWWLIEQVAHHLSPLSGPAQREGAAGEVEG